MKKIILYFIFISFSLNANAETILLKCVYKFIDEKRPSNEIGDETLYEFDLNAKTYIVSENEIKYYMISNFSDTYYTSYVRINRFTGDFIQESAEVKKKEIQPLLDNNTPQNQMVQQDEYTFKLIEGITSRNFFANKYSDLSFNKKPMWLRYELKCDKAKKKF
ncbi:hypothetical protein [Candidatus Pelagibacter communis]|uniref:hypothetical protein n=1 Tax=Pelagibacter ubique TaxID=198252 RepID=UPI00065B3D51|nr:hypothetical protein [Candidatus Pelagibacter ubique]